MLHLGHASEASREPGIDPRRDRLCALIEPLLSAPPPASDERVAAKDWREADLDIVILSERRNAAAAMRERCARAVREAGGPLGSQNLAERIMNLPLDGEG